VLDVDHFEQIRRMYHIDGLSQRAISQKLGHSRKTVRKAIANAVPTAHQGKGQTRSKPTLGDFTKIIDTADFPICASLIFQIPPISSRTSLANRPDNNPRSLDGVREN
jgi:hypothetical protein